MSPFPEIDPEKLKRHATQPTDRLVDTSTFARPVDPDGTLAEFIAGLPVILRAADLVELGETIRSARENKLPLIWLTGAHLVKCGLSPVLVDLMEKGYVTCLALNGAAMIHDYEVARFGRTSEDVQAKLIDGSFGMDSATADPLNRAAVAAKDDGIGLGEAVGKMVEEGDYPYKRLSLLAAAYRAGLPATVHVAIGTDITHPHPSCDGAALGESSLRDFRILAAQVAGLKPGAVVIHVGSAVILPEVFLKALSAARNLGHRAYGFTAANFDMVTHYRPAKNVLERPAASPSGQPGRAFNFVGHHEIMIPLLAAAILRPGK